MPPRSAEEKARRRQLASEKKEAREAKKRAEEEKKKKLQLEVEHKLQSLSLNTTESSVPCLILNVPEVTLGCIFSFLPARELACVSLTCTTFNYSIGEIRISYVQQQLSKTKLCASRQEALNILKSSYGGGDTRRVVTRKQRKSDGKDCDEFMGYARFLEESINGYCKLAVRGRDPIMLPSCINGRYASVSPEHSLSRVGGDGYKSGAGGSGAASWGVGRRGQLGHGERIDLGHPQRLLGGLGYGIRVVQVSAGGGLVRVAHSLFLTSSGRVLSCGNGSYGQLGHGYSQAKQLPDYIRPKYIDAFNGMKIICISAGEIHSAAVNSDGDLFTFGDGFLGMLGHGDKRPQVSPKQVECGGVEDECFSTVSCGCRHTLVVTEDGEVFSMGFGHFGVLGRAFTPFEYDADTALENLGIGGLEADHGFQPLPQNPVIGQAVAIDLEEDPVLREAHEREELQAHLELIANMTLDDASTQCIPQIIDSLQGIEIIGVSAGHRHSIFLEKEGAVYTCGSGVTGALGHGDNISHMYPMKIMEFEHVGAKVMQISAGVDLSMAVSTEGRVYSWGKADGGRLGLAKTRGTVSIPRAIQVETKEGNHIKAIDVECGYVHSLIVGLDGTLYQCGGVGIDGAEDGQQEEVDELNLGKPVQIKDFNIWHRLPEPKAAVKQKERWKKYGKYELQGRSKMMVNRDS
mmetsp:Transcript_13333/g.19610  ORF Transcript_13333/g.19610 Transcript_13333/m.19610 type:complete len:689 (-) Transcript_13333:2282-4348(-)